jgi:hypothetical protein
MHRAKSKKVLALDLEGTLVSNAVSQFPRPGLFEFLEGCSQLFERICIFTTVREPTFRRVAQRLVDDGFAPAWFSTIEYVNWSGKTKDLRFVPSCAENDVILVDDIQEYVHQGQEASWVRIEEFDPEVDGDRELERVLNELAKRAGG